MIFKLKNSFSEFAIYTDESIQSGTVLFRYDDWIEDEKYGWVTLSVGELKQLSPEKRAAFLRYSYDVDFGKVIGTFDWSCAKHISNFMNHSCCPNMMYDCNNNIIARRDIQKDEELTIDYGNFIVNVNQDFICQCGQPDCRRRIKRNDWKLLQPEYGYNFPTFMHKRIDFFIKSNSKILKSAVMMRQKL